MSWLDDMMKQEEQREKDLANLREAKHQAISSLEGRALNHGDDEAAKWVLEGETLEDRTVRRLMYEHGYFAAGTGVFYPGMGWDFGEALNMLELARSRQLIPMKI